MLQVIFAMTEWGTWRASSPNPDQNMVRVSSRPSWLTPVDIRQGRFDPGIFRNFPGHRDERKRSLTQRVANDGSDRREFQRLMSGLYDRSLPHIPTQERLSSQPDIRELALRGAVGEFLTDEGFTKNPRKKDLRVLVVTHGKANNYNVTFPAELGIYAGADVDFLGTPPLLNKQTREACQILFDNKRQFSAVTEGALVQHVFNQNVQDEDTGLYDLVLACSDKYTKEIGISQNPNPQQFTSFHIEEYQPYDNPLASIATSHHSNPKQFATLLFDLLKPGGGLFTSAHPSLDILRTNLVKMAELRPDFKLDPSHDDTVFIDTHSPRPVLVPDFSSDDSQVGQRIVWGFQRGRELAA